MTPAEKLSKNKKRTRPPRNEKRPKRSSPVICHCREKRNELNLSLRDVHAAVGISVSGLHAIEHGGNVEMTTALKLCEFYGCQLTELWSAKKRPSSNTSAANAER